MNTKVVLFMCFVTLVTASPIAPIYPGYGFAAPAVVHSAPVVHAAPYAPVVAHAPLIAKHVVHEPVDPNPHYSFSYGVSDPHTGDNKHASETLVNGVVHGSYSLTEPDGTIRKVTYTADDHNGFNAVVEKAGVAHHAAPIAHAAPYIAHAPAVVAHAPAVLAAPAYHGLGLYHK
ncbi:cuticle protein 7 [Sitodiplosis mosellana]|uniref:cuticle protein 7 n=1 Tax=Sitodiplosis mosellana TaxID=263140 RepID=UPI002444ED9E|nr:cuticle protein 7 [Sitodiplosis mosellana]